MKQAHRPRRTVSVAGEPLTLAELAVAVACGIALAALGWTLVVWMVALGAPR